MDITQSTWNALKRICFKHIYVRRLTILRLYKVHNIVTGLKNSAYVVYFDAFDSQQTHTRRRIMRKWYCIRNHVTKHVTWFSPLSLSLCESLIICFDFVHRDSSFRCCVLIFVVYLFFVILVFNCVSRVYTNRMRSEQSSHTTHTFVRSWVRLKWLNWFKQNDKKLAINVREIIPTMFGCLFVHMCIHSTYGWVWVHKHKYVCI